LKRPTRRRWRSRGRRRRARSNCAQPPIWLGYGLDEAIAPGPQISLRRFTVGSRKVSILPTSKKPRLCLTSWRNEGSPWSREPETKVSSWAQPRTFRDVRCLGAIGGIADSEGTRDPSGSKLRRRVHRYASKYCVVALKSRDGFNPVPGVHLP